VESQEDAQCLLSMWGLGTDTNPSVNSKRFYLLGNAFLCHSFSAPHIICNVVPPDGHQSTHWHQRACFHRYLTFS